MLQRSYLETIKVSFFKTKEGVKYKDLEVGRVLNGIKNGAYRVEIEKGRSYLDDGNLSGYEGVKNCLPAITFCGTFDQHHRENDLIHYNSLLVIDIDKLDELEMIHVKGVLERDSHIAAYWLSPSGRGFKGLVYLHYEDGFMEMPLREKHYIAFKQLFRYLYSNYGVELDTSGKDIPRLCFMSYDSALCVKDEIEAFVVVDLPEEKYVCKRNKKHDIRPSLDVKDWKDIIGKSIDYKDNSINRNKVIYILKKLKKRGLSITDTWENWTKVAFAMASSVHPEKGRELFLELCRLDGINHDEAKSERLIWDAYMHNKGRCNIQTILYLARQKGIILNG